MIYLAAALVFTNTLMAFGFGAYVLISSRDRQSADFEHQERFNAAQERHNDIVQALAEGMEAERELDRQAMREVLVAARKERDVLLDRIQRPEALSAPVAFAEEPSDEPLTLPMDDDKAEWDALAEAQG